MEKYTFDFEVQTLLTMFIHALDDVVIKRHNVCKQPQDRIRVRFVYAPKQRVLSDLLNKDQNLQLPVIACYLGGIARDQTRTFNKLQGTFSPINGLEHKNEKQPLPVDVSVNVSILTRYQSDMDQILTNILPYFDPYIVISWRPPGRPDFEIRSSIYWSGNVSLTYPNDLASTQVARIAADTSFTIKGWLFKSSEQDPIGTIHNITTSMGFDDIQTGVYSMERLLEDFQTGSDRTIHGVPPQPILIQPYTILKNQRAQIITTGRGYTKINNVYLSGSPLSAESTFQHPFSSAQSLSASYPGFNAVKLSSSEWSYDKNSIMSFASPSVSASGFLDLIIQGPAGYGSLKENVRIDTFNPYPPGSPDYNNFVPYQFPFLSGLELI